jgi:alkanesulfonate monooxygenase SsuD/methylene tetrahydromethanopterin reductase-like flavin-dependent oxidoreductase (luciferase family)
VGVGWSEPEFTALGVPFRRRGEIADEYLVAIVAAWTEERVSLDGRYARYRDVSTGPRSARTPHPPLWVGGLAPAAIRRAARFGDAWHPNNAELEWLRDKGLPTLHAAAADCGRPVPAFCPRVRVQPSPRDLPAAGRRVGTGSLAQICDDVTVLKEMGATYVVLDTNPDDPRDRQPAAADWRVLSAISERLR